MTKVGFTVIISNIDGFIYWASSETKTINSIN